MLQRQQGWYDEIAAPATFPLHLEHLLLSLESGKWKLEAGQSQH
jgi:hypothetical protein